LPAGRHPGDRLHAIDAHCGAWPSPQTPEQTSACRQHLRASDDLSHCLTKVEARKQADLRAKWEAESDAYFRRLSEERSQTLQSLGNFTNAPTMGMSPQAVDDAEQEAFHDPWGRKVHTTVTANGTTEQWIYWFPEHTHIPTLYLYFVDGKLSAVQN
jgi:hypothetical protein